MTLLFAAIALATLLVACDVDAVSLTGLIAAVVLALAAGFAIGAWRALLLSLAVLAGLFVSDVLWQLEWAPYDHADAREPLPATFVAVFYVPAAMTLIALGVAGRKLTTSRPGARRGRPARLSGH